MIRYLLPRRLALYSSLHSRAIPTGHESVRSVFSSVFILITQLNNKRSTSPPTAWHWPATRPATPNSEVCLSSTTTSTRDPSPTIALRNGVLVNAAPTHDSVLEDGLASFFHSDGDELMEDKTWCQPRKAPSLAELLGRVELLGNVDVALSEIRSMQDEETRREEIIRGKVMARFMQVMGPKGPGLAVKKCHRGGRGSAGIALGAKDVSTLNRIDYFLLEGSDVRGRNEDFLRLPLGNTMASHWREWRQRHTSPLLQHE